VAFSSPYVWLVYLQFFILLVAVVLQMAWLVTELDIGQLILIKANIPAILLAETLTLILYLVFNFSRLYVYHHSLTLYYNKLPAQLKDCFTAPA
jgi:hypothetical protein